MRISIFPNCTPHPKSAEEKKANARFTSRPHKPEIVEVNDEDTLLDVITNYAWSPAIFRDYRRKSDFISIDYMVLDIDNELTIEEAEKRCNDIGVFAIIAPSPNFSLEHHKFRVVFPLSITITDTEDFEHTWAFLASKFPELDQQCSDSCRFYFACKAENGCIIDYDMLLEPRKAPPKPKFFRPDSKKLIEVDGSLDEYLGLLYERIPTKIPESIDFFLREGSEGLPGGWQVPLNAFVFTLSLQGVDKSAILSVIEHIAPDPLDERDENTIEKAFKDGTKARTQEIL